MNRKTIYSIIIVVLTVVAFFAFWYFRTPVVPVEEIKDQGSLGGQIYDQSTNPLQDKLPETNPFSGNINPLGDVYKNPFE